MFATSGVRVCVGGLEVVVEGSGGTVSCRPTMSLPRVGELDSADGERRWWLACGEGARVRGVFAAG